MRSTSPRPPATREVLRVMFLHTSAGIGGAETLMMHLIRRLDRTRFAPELCCLKELGVVGEMLAEDIPTFDRLLSHKYDLRVLPRLASLMRQRRIDAVICVGAGDKMFWGRLAARLARVPVVICAIHSTGWPDRITRLNRLLTPLTDMFVGVAETHGRYLREEERFPSRKVRVIRNGIDTELFCPRPANPELRRQLGLRPGPVAGTVARLTPEKNHEMFLAVSAAVRQKMPEAQFVIVGDGPLGVPLRQRAQELGLSESVHFLGYRADVAEILALLDAFLLTSHIEANPVSVLEALATGVPVVSTRVGSVPETVSPEVGFLVEPEDAEGMARRVLKLLGDPGRARELGTAGRQRVLRRWSVDTMVHQYEDLIETLYANKRPDRESRQDRSSASSPLRLRKSSDAVKTE